MMKCKFFLLVLVFFPIVISAQNIFRSQGPSDRLSLDGQFTYYRGFNIVNIPEKDRFPGSQESIEDGSTVDYIDVGLNVSYRMTRKLALGTGLHFSNPAFRSSENTELVLSHVDVHAENRGRISKDVVVRRNFLEVPTFMRVTVTEIGKCKSYIELGVNHQFYLSTKTEGAENLRSMVEAQNLYKIAGLANMGAEFKMSQEFILFTQLNMTYQFTPMKQVEFADRHSSIGFSVGARMIIY